MLNKQQSLADVRWIYHEAIPTVHFHSGSSYVKFPVEYVLIGIIVELYSIFNLPEQERGLPVHRVFYSSAVLLLLFAQH